VHITKENTVGPESPEKLKAIVEKSLDADKAEDITTIDLRGHSALADYMVIASGRSSRQVSALAEKLRDRLKARGITEIRLEGIDKGDWAVVDAGDIIVHIFRPEVRDYYALEKMWQAPHLMQSQKANIVRL
jgi:ribosome-associated protein